MCGDRFGFESPRTIPNERKKRKKSIGEHSNRCAQRIMVCESASIYSGRALIIDIVSLAHLSPLATVRCVTQHRYARDSRSRTSQPRWQSVNNINRRLHRILSLAVFFVFSPVERNSRRKMIITSTGQRPRLPNEFRACLECRRDNRFSWLVYTWANVYTAFILPDAAAAVAVSEIEAKDVTLL